MFLLVSPISKISSEEIFGKLEVRQVSKAATNSNSSQLIEGRIRYGNSRDNSLSFERTITSKGNIPSSHHINGSNPADVDYFEKYFHDIMSVVRFHDKQKKIKLLENHQKKIISNNTDFNQFTT
ncbi:hypothetical protein ACTFIV_000661 [Dictyostelium citrinum]